MTVSAIPTTELLNDKAECKMDIWLCETALSGGIETYGDDCSVKGRLEGNKAIVAKIDAELMRRNCGHKMEKDIGVVTGPYPFQAVYHCPFRSCVQWLIEFPVDAYTAPTCQDCGNELVTGEDGKAECVECGERPVII